MIVIFDMDGTLIDSGTDMTISINHLRKQKNLPLLSVDEVTSSFSTPNLNLAKKFYDIDYYDDTHKEIFHSHYIEQCTKNVKLYDGIYDLLKELKYNNIKMNVATNAYTVYAQKMLKHLEVDQYFNKIIGADKVKKSKPNPEMLDICKENIENDKTILIGDSQKDCLGAKNANIKFIFAKWGYGNNCSDNPEASSPYELSKLLKSFYNSF
jgi:phosphoglycolate phosphatase